MKRIHKILVAAACVLAGIGVAFAAADQISRGSPDGAVLGQSSSDHISFYGATTITQPTAADQAALTDNSGGTKSATTGVSANAQKQVIVFPIGVLTGLANSQVWRVSIPYAFTVTACTFRVGVPVTTGSKAATLTAQVAGTPVTGGVISLTSANATPTGAAVTSTAITGANTGTAGQSLELAVSSVTAFIEGSGWVECTVSDTDKANESATFAAFSNAVRSALVNLGLIKGQ